MFFVNAKNSNLRNELTYLRRRGTKRMCVVGQMSLHGAARAEASSQMQYRDLGVFQNCQFYCLLIFWGILLFFNWICLLIFMIIELRQ